ncbi:hypothetical protein CCR75_004164 [Bremia lactucae]|uniref:RAVE complex protein Rav1 C-terminal domain-containing protein n=1 Tax=Bremia lactucae TaxID=4779 RepID=A0A976IE07_BRELC|nr:hypothetical protein CCR75_004164 [Bremia lactucae]
MRVRAWSWTRIDGRNVLAVPMQTEIFLYDSDDFILISHLAPSGHHSPIAFVRWSAFHGRLASLSLAQILVHAPQRDPQARGHVHFVAICSFRFDEPNAIIRELAFSRNADELLYCGPHVGIGKLDVRGSSMGMDDAPVIWKTDTEGGDLAKFSPSAFVFATLSMQKVKIWRMKRRLGDPDQRQTLYKVESLIHSDPVTYFSWKPSTMQWRSKLETDGTRKAQWFEPARILLTCTATKLVRIWTERKHGFESMLVFEPTNPLDNVRWVQSKNKNISDEHFHVVEDAHKSQADWISGVDRHGILRLWRLEGISTSKSAVEETALSIQVNGEDVERKQDVKLGEAMVMAYFSQNNFDMPSKLEIVLQRADYIMLSFHVAVGKEDRPSRILKKSWYRSHIGNITALSAHPSLPLIASVDSYASELDGSWRNEILVYWISFSAFSAEQRLIPSGVLPCEETSGDVLCIQWVPTLHFDATPVLLVAFESGEIGVYGRSARADIAVVNSPKVSLPKKQHIRTRSPSLSPWTFYDYTTGESGFEYEIKCENLASNELEIDFEEKSGKLYVLKNHSRDRHLREILEGDQLVGINNNSVVGKKVTDVLILIDNIFSSKEYLLMRFRAFSMQKEHNTTERTVDDRRGGNAETHSIKESESEICQSFLSSLKKTSFSSEDHVIHAGAVSIYGGWRQLTHVKVALTLSLLCVCPTYAVDGEYVPDSVLIFGIESVPGKLRVWKGVRDRSIHSFVLLPVQIQGAAFQTRDNITTIAGERDYRQRAFSSKRADGHESLNSLLFIGDAVGNIEHWRCQIVESTMHFTVMSTSLIRYTNTPTSINQVCESTSSFYRRGYVWNDQKSYFRRKDNAAFRRICHIEVDDPNRLAVLYADRPGELQIFEAESGLGMLRPEESIPSNGRGNIIGFTWCNAHVEFKIDALAVRYESTIVIYQYDTTLHRYGQIGDDIKTLLPLFDCTRDSSALLICGGHISKRGTDRLSLQSISNEMPVVIGKWDEPGSLLQRSMDWKATETPQKLPVWHPYVLLTTMFGMHARVGEKDTYLAGDREAYEFSRAFNDATQMLKLLAKVLEHEPSAQASALHGVLLYTGPVRLNRRAHKENSEHARKLESIGRYSTSIHRSDQIDRAENLFAASISKDNQRIYDYGENECYSDVADHRTLAKGEAAMILAAVESILDDKFCSIRENASIMFVSFSEENVLEMKALLHFVNAIQSLGFDLDASAADLGAKRFFSMYVFIKSLTSVVLAHPGCGDKLNISNPQNGECEDEVNNLSLYSECDSGPLPPSLENIPSSGILWALHSDSQQFLWEHCTQPQMQWDDFRPLWLGLWIKDVKNLHRIVDRFAKSSYARTKNAMDVCLLYVALGKKKMLSALANMTQSESNKTLASFLVNDFSENRWSNAAIRNAYSLLSKKRYDVAAAFFLLCEPPRIQDAIRVIAVRLEDPGLALIIARLAEYQAGDKLKHDFTTSQATITPAGNITKQLLKQDIIPIFRQKHDIWLESCALWWLEDFEQAWTVLLPRNQDVDVFVGNKVTALSQNDLLSSVLQATHFYVNLTSLAIYSQYLYSNINSSLLTWAKEKIHAKQFLNDSESATLTKKRLQLVSMADIEHAFSFAAYVCKRNGLSDTALVEMLQARHLVNVHARFEISTVEAGDLKTDRSIKETRCFAANVSTSPRFASSVKSWRQGNKLECTISPSARKSPRQGTRNALQRRNSCFGDLNIALNNSQMPKKLPRDRANSFSWYKNVRSKMPTETVPWLVAQIADIECRRWASSAFVGKMIGIRVAREMISHFRAELDVCFRHGDGFDSCAYDETVSAQSEQLQCHRLKLHNKFLNELCTPLCEQFQVDRKYVLEAALAVLHPHAYLHIVEVCFLLSELERVSTLRKWIEYVSLSMLHSCSTFASCIIAEEVYRDWEGLTIQLCFVLNLDAQRQISIQPRVVAHIGVAVRTGIIFLGWARQRSDIVRQAVTLPFYAHNTVKEALNGASSPLISLFAFQTNLGLLRNLLRRPSVDTSEIRKTRILEGSLGYTFLGAVASRPASDDNISLLLWGGFENAESQNQHNIRKMYTLILMVSVLRTLHARATQYLSTYENLDSLNNAKRNEADIASSLFTPQKLWKVMGEGPLEGLKRWYALIESHLRCEFDYSVNEVPCLCGLYGLDGAATEEVAAADNSNDVAFETSTTDDYNTAESKEELKGKTVNPSASIRFDMMMGMDNFEGLQAFLQNIGMSMELHNMLTQASDDYVLLLMQNPKVGVRTSVRRFRIDPRVYVKSLVLRDVFSWFARLEIFRSDFSEAHTIAQIHAFLSRCCKQRKLRLLVAHRGEIAPTFALDRPRAHSHEASTSGRHLMMRSRFSSANGSESFIPDSFTKLLSEAFYLQSLMFVDPWEVEAEWNVRRFMHDNQSSLHVELGWDRLSPICSETCDAIVASVFEDPDLVAMWKATGGEGWLVTAITQYRIDGLHSYRTLHQHIQRGLAEKEEPRIPFLVAIYSRSQRNAMFKVAGLPHRFVGAVTVELVEAKDLIACHWLQHWSDAYVFVELCHAKDKCRETAEEWSLQTYRSSVGEGGVNPHWESPKNRFVFRFAIPTHNKHTCGSRRDVQYSNREGIAREINAHSSLIASQIWNADINDLNRDAVDALDKLLSSVYKGPPSVLQCTVYQKNKVLSHQFMGRATISLDQLTPGNPMDCWLPLQDTSSGLLRLKISLSFQLMCSTMAGKSELNDLR